MIGSMETPCIFCQIIAGESPARIVYRDDNVIAIHDIVPQAPTHILVLPVQHISSLAETQDNDGDLLGQLCQRAVALARQTGLPGYRLVINTGAQGGQTVGHLHIHLLAGRQMKWPPG
jgi:histidine triad (HIT) family protein